MAQLNTTVGDFSGNFEKARKTIETAVEKKADIVVFSELFVTGYPPKDLLEQKWFIDRAERYNEKYHNLSRCAPSTAIVVGSVQRNPKRTGKGLYNSALVLLNGEIIFSQPKTLLPYYDIFDEGRYFDSSGASETFVFKKTKIGLTICEDAWSDPDFWGGNTPYERNPVDELCKKSAKIIINISASPFSVGKQKKRKSLFGNIAEKYGVFLVYLNQVGANDELIFDGDSFALSEKAKTVVSLQSFREEIAVIDTGETGFNSVWDSPDETVSIFKALSLGVKDYFIKCGFKKALVGLSGGIDSAVTACVAVDALGKENVTGITMPSRFSSDGSVGDSVKLASNLGIKLLNIDIDGIYESYVACLKKHFENRPFDSSEENIQARIRGNILMALSNKFGSIVLSTGNKSEMAVGYCTLYGDMSGGLAVLSDVPKTTVYKLADYINKNSEKIPMNTIKKAPSAELRYNQKDQDTLPPYDILDRILELFIEENFTAGQIVKSGFKKETVEWVIKKVFQNEYKRQQAALGLKITEKAFGSGRRMPVAAKADFISDDPI